MTRNGLVGLMVVAGACSLFGCSDGPATKVDPAKHQQESQKQMQLMQDSTKQMMQGQGSGDPKMKEMMEKMKQSQMPNAKPPAAPAKP